MFANFQIRDLKKKGKTAPQNPSYKVFFFFLGGGGERGWGLGFACHHDFIHPDSKSMGFLHVKKSNAQNVCLKMLWVRRVAISFQ